MHIFDYIIFFVYMIGVLAVGYYFFKKNESRDDYYVGGRKAHPYRVGLSLVATDVGGGFSIGLGGLGFLIGLSGSWLLFTGLVGAWIGAVFLIPVIKKFDKQNKMLTYPDFLRYRFNHRVALAAAIISGIGYLGFTGSQVIAGATLASNTLFTRAPLGMDPYLFSFYLIAFVIIVYTVLGGLNAVMLTDAIQWTMILGGLALIAIPLAYYYIGIKWLHEVPEGYTIINYAEGRAPYYDDGEYGYINHKGEIVIPPQFEEAAPFSDMVALVKQDGRYGYIFEYGDFAVEPQYIDAKTFSEELGAVKIDNNEQLWGFIDYRGQWIIEPEYQDVSPFSAGLSAVQQNELYGYIDTSGEWMISPRYQAAGDFKEIREEEYLAPVKLDGQYGYINSYGETVIDHQFDYAFPFSNGLARIRDDERYGFIDAEGNIAISPTYEQASDFSNGLASVSVNDLYGYIDDSGEMLIDAQYSAAGDFYQGLARVGIGDVYGYIDRTGSFVISPEEIQQLHDPLERINIGGMQALRQSLEPQFFTLTNVTPVEFFNWMITIIPIWIIGMTIYQRIYACKDVKEAKKAWYIAGLFEYPIMAFVGVILGMFSRVLFPHLPAAEAEAGMPMLISHILPMGLAGLVVAAYFSAIMSTADSTLVASSGNFTNDMLERYFLKKTSQKKLIRISQLMTLGIGAIAIAIASFFDTVLDAILYTYSFMVGGLLVPTVGAYFWKRASSTAALAAMIVGGTTTVIFMVSGLSLPFDIDGSVAGILLSLIVFVPLSYAVPDSDKEGGDTVRESDE